MTSPTPPTVNGVIPTLLTGYPLLQVPTAIDYTSKDFLGLATSMLNYAGQAMPNWNTNSEGDMGVMMLELMAYAGDILSYYGDRLTQEAYLATATQRLSILNIAQLLGYVPTNGTPATGTVTFQTDATQGNTVVPIGTQVSSSIITSVDAPVIYQTNNAITVPGSGGTQSVAVTQGITSTMVQVGTSDGTAGQQFAISQTGVEDGSVSVFVQTTLGSEQWNFIQFLVDAGPVDKVYTTFVDASGITQIQFGDGINGMIPAVGLTIWATYTVIVGSAGNVAANQVNLLVSSIPGISISSSTAMGGGSDPETNDQIRVNAPQAYRAAFRAVSLQDYADLALNVPGVLMASASANHNTSVGLYILGPNYAAPSTALQSAVLEYFDDKTTAGVSLSILNPNLIAVDVGSNSSNVTVQVAPNYSIGTVIQGVTQALQLLLSPPNSQFGELLTLSDIMGAIMAIPGVQWCTVPLFTREDVTQTNTNSIQFRASEIPIPGTMYLTGQGGLGT